jgi:hypothetical protein
MPKWLDILIKILIWLLPSGGTVAVAILAWLKHVPAYLIVIGVVAVIALGFLGVNQIALFRQRHHRGLSKQTDKEIENTIKEWIDIPGFTIKRSEVDENKTYFMFTVTDDCDRQVHIWRGKQTPYYITMSSEIKVGSRPDIIGLTPENLRELASKLSLEMLRLGCSHEFDFKEKEFVLKLYNSVFIEDSLTDIIFRKEGHF